MRISTTKINKDDLITLRDIPQGTDTCAMITYMGMSVLVPVETLYDGSYRVEFVKQYGVPLPTTVLPKRIKKVFSPNLKVVIK